MERTRQLGEESVGRLLWKFSIPAIVGMMVNALYNIVDRIFVGRGVGLLAISATTVAFPIMIVMLAFGLLIGIGAAVVVSIKLGQQNKAEAEHILGNALSLTVIVSVFLMVLGLLFQEPLLLLFGASKEVLPLAKEFITIILIGTLPFGIGLALNHIIRSEGNPRIAMLTMLIGAVLNCILNPIFIFGLHWGIKGSALATVISQLVCTIWVLAYFMGKKSLLKLKRENLRLSGHIVQQILAVGLSSFLLQLVSSVIMILFNQSLRVYGGDVGIAAIGIINSIVMLILMPVFGITQGAQPIIGYNYGAGNYERVVRTLKLGIVAATCVTLVGFVLVQAFPDQILRVFSNQDERLITIGSPGIRLLLLVLPIIGFQVVGSTYFQAVGKAKLSIFLTLSRQIIFLMPLLLILPHMFQITGVWISGPISDFISTGLTGLFILRELRVLRQQQGAAKLELSEVS